VKHQIWAALAWLLMLTAGCVAAPAPAYTGYVTVAPPAPRPEVIGVAPVPGYVWIGGYWGWSNGRHQWQEGHWEAPRPGYHWSAHRWEQEGNGWREHPGHWEPDHR
jgi:WXXGXW repeat (2 copies)